MDRREMVKLATVGALGVTATTALGGIAEARVAQPAQPPIKEGCACNLTGQDIMVYICSGYSVVQAFVKKNACFYFNFYDDGKKRVLSAFGLPNELIVTFTFVPLPNVCFLIEPKFDGKPNTKDGNKAKDEVTTIPV